MTDTAAELAVVKTVVDSGPIQFPREIAYHPEIGFTIIVYRSQLMAKFSDEENQTIARWLMETTKRLTQQYKIKAQWVRE